MSRHRRWRRVQYEVVCSGPSNRHASAWTLGDCLSTAIDAATGHDVTEMDDDGRHHRQTADFIYIADLDVLAEWGSGHEETKSTGIPGATMPTGRELALEYRFARSSQAEDTDLLHRLTAAGGTLYSESAGSLDRLVT